MKLYRHALFMVLLVITADATANSGAETRGMLQAASLSIITTKFELAGYHIREDMRRVIGGVLN